jgi:hypothetical protein
MLTEDEEKAHVVRDRIKVAKSPPPPADLAEQIEELRRLADAGDREGIAEVIRELVPTYRWTPNGAAAPFHTDRVHRPARVWPAEVQPAMH